MTEPTRLITSKGYVLRSTSASFIPQPTLKFRFWGRDNRFEYVEGDVPIHDVTEISCSVDPRGALTVYVSGVMRKKDGTAARHGRSAQVDLGKPQPLWLVSVIGDAIARLYHPVVQR